jgi:hypothetical protein
MPRLSSKSAVSSGWELPATLDAPVSDQLTEVAYSISEKNVLFWSFSYVCPEPVLVK